MTVEPKQLNSLALAYVGDAVYELRVRTHLIASGQVKPQQLHEKAVQFVTAPAQAKVIKMFLERELLTAEEIAVTRRGRNAKSHSVPKNISIENYRYATAFEALIGFHYLNQSNERLNELINKAIFFIQNEKDSEK